jgi:PAS domain S-box-containing protein
LRPDGGPWKKPGSFNPRVEQGRGPVISKSIQPQPADLGVEAFGVSLLSASHDCIKIIDLDGSLQLMNRNGQTLMEVDDFCAIQGGQWPSLWPEESRPLVQASLDAALAGRPARFSAFCPTAKGTPKWWDVSVSPVHGPDGKVMQVVSISRDITEERRLTEAYRVLSQELSHRIKNLFTLANGLITLSAAADPTAKSFAVRLRDRFTSLGRAVSYIRPADPNAPPTDAQTLSGLFEALVEPFQTDPDHPRIQVSGCEGPVGPQSATALALVVHELATNAVKYGALSTNTGWVELVCKQSDGRVGFTWREHGGPPVHAPPTVMGFGTKLATISTSGHLSGSIVHDWRPEGLVVVLDVSQENLSL